MGTLRNNNFHECRQCLSITYFQAVDLLHEVFCHSMEIDTETGRVSPNNHIHRKTLAKQYAREDTDMS